MRSSLPTSLALLPILVACGSDDPAEPDIIDIIVDACCCDPNSTTGTTGTTDAGTPIATSTARDVDLGIVCGEGTATFTLGNEGDGDLTILDVTTSSAASWTVVSQPDTIAPGETADLVLSGGNEDATVTVTTNDADSPTLTLSISATPNAGPTVESTWPASGERVVVPAGATETFWVDLADDQAGLEVRWTSDVDGQVSWGPASADGMATAPWDSALQTEGEHTITAVATDTCGQEVQHSFAVCQNAGYAAENLDLDTWQITGNAFYDTTNGWVQLVAPYAWQQGSAFQTSETVQSDDVEISFSFYVGDSDYGADGFSVTAIDTTQLVTYEGDAGGSIGYGSLPGWSIEVDTYDNTSSVGYSEPYTTDHVSLNIGGDAKYIGEVYAQLPNMEDGAWHTMDVKVDGIHVTVTIDGTTYIDDDVPALTAFPAHVGFTAATGAQHNYHLIDALTVQTSICDEG